MKEVLLFILFCFSIFSFSQEIVYKQFSSKEGLVSSHVSQVIQDYEGFIWISTNNGVARFDGYDFENFNIKNKLPENDIVGIFKSEDSTIWFLGRSGLLSYFKDGAIHPYLFNDKVLFLLENYNSIESNSLIISDESVEFNIYEDARYSIDSTGAIKRLYGVLDKQNIIDLKDQKVKYFISSQIKEFQIIGIKDTSVIIIPLIFCNEPILCKKVGQKVFMSNQNKLFVIEDGDLKSYSYDNTIVSLQIDQENSVWLGFELGGVFCYKDTTITQQPYYHGLKGNTVSSVIRDRKNSFWMTSVNSGLFYFPSQLFKQVTIKDGLLDNNITQLDLSNNYLWTITGNNVVARLNFLGVKNYNFNNNDFTTVTSELWYDNTLWISFKNKITYFEGEELVELFRLRNNIGEYSQINRIDPGIGNDLWVSKTNGFVQLRNKKVVFESSFSNHQKLNVNGIIAESNGDLWLACKNGLWKFHAGKLLNYNQNNSLLSKNIIDFVKDEKKGALWLAINGIGVVKILNDSIHLISRENGLVSNSVTSIFAFGNNVWVGTKEGITKIHIKNNGSETFTNITKKDGLISNEVNDIVANDKYVFVASNNGLGFFDYTKYHSNQKAPVVKIMSIEMDSKLEKSQTRIILDYYSNNIKINYKAIHFKSQSEIDYRFRIKGLDKNWTYTQLLSANYPFLPSGEYIFQIQASNENGVWASSFTELNILVKKPFWLQWWFFLIVLLIILAVGYFLYKILISVREKKERIRREINEYRQIALTRQMNPHFIFNSLNSIQHYILQNDIRLSNRFLSKFSKLIRLILENSINPLISLEKELVALDLYLELESLRFKEKMKYVLHIDPKIDTFGVTIPPMLIQPFVENAIWHGIMHKDNGTGLLEIKFSLENDDSIVCAIKDNGVGRQKSTEINQEQNRTHNSMGTSITQDRIDLINAFYNNKIIIEYEDPEDEYGVSLGTLVKIIFMLK